MAKHGIDVKALKAALKTKGIKFGGRSSDAKLAKLAEANGIAVPAKKGGNIIGDDYRKKYGKAQTIGDTVSDALRKAVTGTTKSGKDGKGTKEFVDPKLLKSVGKANGVDTARWDHLNVGQQRMNLGNVLRAMVKRGEHVEIGLKVWKGNAKAAKEAATA